MSPQEKKQLSYDRDRRNAYGENDKASRKAIPRGKRQAARAARRLASRHMPRNVTDVPVEQATDIDTTLAAARRKYRWRKEPDIPLRDYVARQKDRRR